jgi:hypothetical protein
LVLEDTTLVVVARKGRCMAGLSMDILTLDISGVIVVSTVEVLAIVLMFQRVSVSQMTVSSRDKIMELVCGVRWVMNQVFQFKGSQGERG